MSNQSQAGEGGGSAAGLGRGPVFGTFCLIGTDDWVTVGGSDKRFVDHIARAVNAYKRTEAER